MQPRRVLLPLRPTVFQVTNNGLSSYSGGVPVLPCLRDEPENLPVTGGKKECEDELEDDPNPEVGVLEDEDVEVDNGVDEELDLDEGPGTLSALLDLIFSRKLLSSSSISSSIFVVPAPAG